VSYVLDTNAVSAVMKGDPLALARLREAPKREVMVPQPVLAEIAYGIARLPKSRKKESLRGRFELVKHELLRAEWTDAVSEAFGDIKALLERRGTPIEDFDVAIAAHAQAREAILVTTNLAHMVRVPGLRVEDWAKAL
jgi:tRNA(fMet)-specific endonuclease VapC